ncbi:Tn3 family transposase (plasmid) [Bacillus tropicus]|nr:Tn3 family transposase [Bacillus tropicus]
MLNNSEFYLQLYRIMRVDIPEEYLQHISPLGWEHITLTGDYV